MRDHVPGEQYAQVDNADPFTAPVWRSPVHRTPEWVIWLVQLVRLLIRVIWFLIRHPLLDAAAGGRRHLGEGGLARRRGPGQRHRGRPGDAAAARPDWYARLVTVPAKSRWRWWCYRRRWQPVMTIAGLAPMYRGRVTLPVLGKVQAGPCADLVTVRLVSGQSPSCSPTGPGAGARVRGAVVPHPHRRTRDGGPGTGPPGRPGGRHPGPAHPRPDLRALPVGRCEDGSPFTIRLHGTHLLIAGATGAGKGSYIWGLVRAMLPAMLAGLAVVHACDPKLMELAFGRPLFERHGTYAADPADIADLLEADVADMQNRAARFAGRQRDHTPTTEFPFVVVLVDEVAFLTAYQADRKLKERILAALATLTTQGRAVGYSVVAALQDPRKEVLNIRNLFPDKIALRLDEPAQADLVLGDGAHDRGALCDEISADPATGAGVGYVRLETSPDPVRVRAAFVTDDRHPRHGAGDGGFDHRIARHRRCPDCAGPLPRHQRPATGPGPARASPGLRLSAPPCGYRTARPADRPGATADQMEAE